jgi:hypothetical protein
MDRELRWYAVPTRSRHEKKGHEQLADRPWIDVFLALRQRPSWNEQTISTPKVRRVDFGDGAAANPFRLPRLHPGI